MGPTHLSKVARDGFTPPTEDKVTLHRGRRTGLSGKRGALTIDRFVQPSHSPQTRAEAFESTLLVENTELGEPPV